jgi:hypothetical protein
MVSFVLNSISLAGDPMPSSGGGLGELFARVGLFLLGMLVFVGACSLAWRYVPWLRALVPQPEDADRILGQPAPEFKPSRVIDLLNLDKSTPAPAVAKAVEAVKPEVVAEAPKPIVGTSSTPILEAIEKAKQKARDKAAAEKAAQQAENEAAEEEEAGLELPVAAMSAPKEDYSAMGEGGMIHNGLEAALADGRPGSVVKAASDINGVATSSPIVIVSREE